jgi:endonuclease/exonuclease/phosphatase family metal-dependent hydrolase
MSSLIEIFSLNTWGFAWPLARHRSRRFLRIARHLDAHAYDVVALQELWRGARDLLTGHHEHGDRQLPWAGEEVQVGRDLRMQQSGLGFRVRDGLRAGTAAVSELVRAFSVHRGWDRVKTKGLLGLGVDAGPHRVAVVNTHLQAGEGLGYIRRHQLDEVLETLDKVSMPVILCGDFNLYRAVAEDRAAERHLERHGFIDASLTVDEPEPTYRHANPYVGGRENHRFDRIYLRDGRVDGQPLRLRAKSVEVLVDHLAPMSDHEPIRATIEVGAP